MVSLLLILSTSVVGLSQEQPFETYQNNDFGFTIQHPSDWEVSEAGNISSIREDDVLKPWESVIDDVTITAPQTVIEGVSDNKPRSPAQLYISVFEPKEEKYLDPNEMIIKSRVVPNFTSNELANEWVKGKTDFFGPNGFETVRNNETVVGVGKYPAWRVDGMIKFADGSYNTMIYSVFNNKIYAISSDIASLAAPEYLPTIQKMLDSFQITQAGNATGNEISPELDCDQNPDAEGCDQGDGSTNGERNEDDQSTDEEDDNDSE